VLQKLCLAFEYHKQCEELMQHLISVRRIITEQAIEELKSMKEELEEKLGSRILSIEADRCDRIYILTCRDESPGYYEMNDKLRSILQEHGLSDAVEKTIFVCSMNCERCKQCEKWKIYA